MHERSAVLRLARPWSLSCRVPLDAAGFPANEERLSWDFVPYDTLQLLAPAEAEVRKRTVPTASAVGPETLLQIRFTRGFRATAPAALKV